MTLSIHRVLVWATGILIAPTLLAQSNTVGTIQFDPSTFSNGYTLVYPHNQPHARLIDACGEVVHLWTNDSTRRPGNSAYLSPMGNLLWAHRSANISQDPIWAGGGGEVIESRTWNNEVLWSYALNDSNGRLHHDFAVTNMGTVLAIAWDRVDSLTAVEAGRDPALLEDGELWSERIIELMPNDTGGADVIWEWRAWDHLVQDFDSTKANFGVISQSPHLIDLNFGTPSSAAADWLHMNSIDYSPSLNQILVSIPTMDELWIIDKAAPENGLIWRWGNPEAHGQGVAADQVLHYQHAATWLDAPYHQNSPDFGKIAVFNNRNPGATGPYSSAHLIDAAWDANDSAYAMSNGLFDPANFDWTWTASPPTDFFSSGLSNFERLPNGNNLILGGRTGEIFEFTPSGDIAWHYRLPIQAGLPVAQGTELGVNDNLLFRAVRYPAQFPAFANANLEPMGTWELEPVPLTACLPCELNVDVNATDGLAYVDVEGANGDYSVIWMIDDVTICTEDTLSINGSTGCAENAAFLVSGETVTIWVTDDAGCEITTEFSWIVSDILERSSSLCIYPNPASDRVLLSGPFVNEQADLYSAAGSMVRSFPLTTGAEIQELSLHGVSPGHYIMLIGTHHMPLIIVNPSH